jgi:hypothetical protein
MLARQRGSGMGWGHLGGLNLYRKADFSLLSASEEIFQYLQITSLGVGGGYLSKHFIN